MQQETMRQQGEDSMATADETDRGRQLRFDRCLLIALGLTESLAELAAEMNKIRFPCAAETQASQLRGLVSRLTHVENKVRGILDAPAIRSNAAETIQSLRAARLRISSYE
jgi:hypothetical protein